jgi:putative hydrolase of the HAD superfamily
VFRAVFFDLDDTLIDRRDAFAAWASARLPAFVDRLTELDDHGRTPRPQFCAAAASLGLTITPEEFFAAITEHVPPAPRSVALVAEVARTRRVAIVTNGGSRTQRAKLARAGLDRACEVFVSAEVGAEKPSPHIFARALAWAGCPADEALFVGDDPERDVVGATRAGMATAWIAHGRAWPAGLAPPTFTLADVREVRGVLA